jgi:hypothetical protein
MSPSRTAALTLAALLWWIPVPAVAQDGLTTIRKLYDDAMYREALAMINAAEKTPPESTRERAALAQYRALCLLALNQPEAAELALAAMVSHEPLALPATLGLPPRVQERATQVRRRLLPDLARQAYTDGKQAFDARKYTEAVEQFDEGLALVNAATASGGAPAELDDLRIIIVGFRDLALAARPAPAAPVPTPAPAPVSPPQNVSRPPAITPVPAAEVAPTVVRQDIPAWPTQLQWVPRPLRGEIEVQIDMEGRVTSARMRTPINAVYDQLLLGAARQWRYTPAKKGDGTPIPFLKILPIEVR